MNKINRILTHFIKLIKQDRLLPFAILIPLLVTTVNSCGPSGNKDATKQTAQEAKGGVVYGGVFRINEVEDLRNLYPLNTIDAISYRIAGQIYEGLVKFSQKDLSVVPCIAENWQISEEKLIYTFKLRKGVFFHDDPCFAGGKGREVTAQDFKYCFDKLCESNPNNSAFWIFKDKVKGANEYYESTVNKQAIEGGVSGVSVIDNNTLKIELLKPFASFLSMLGTPLTCIFPKEAVEKYGVEMRTKCVGTGPFKMKEVKVGEVVILTKNEKYWESDEFGNKLPYLDALKFTFFKEKTAELMEFRKGNLDMVFQLPSEMIDQVIEDLDKVDSAGAKSFDQQYNIQITPALSIQYYGFQHLSDIFNNKLVRQAFNYSLDRNKIVEFTLKGEGVAAMYGFIPPAFKGYNVKNIKGFTYDPDKARSLLAKAGYPNGKGFPEIQLQLNSGGTRNLHIAEAIQQMLTSNLNIKVKLDLLPLPQHVENLESGKALFWRSGWIADYPDPENFLNLLYSLNIPKEPEGKSYINISRYASAEFDSVFKLALRTTDENERYKLYEIADQIAIDDAAVIPILYDEHIRLLHPYVKGLDANAMEYRDFRRVYIDKLSVVPGEKEEKDEIGNEF